MSKKIMQSKVPEKNSHNFSEFDNFEFYLLRSPKFSLENLEEFLKFRERDLLEAFLRNLYSQDFMKEALYLSSKPLFFEVEKWLSHKKLFTKKLANTLYKYTVRSSFRCTPFGYFAGIQLGNVSKLKGKRIEILRNNNDKVIHRLDLNFLTILIKELSKKTQLKQKFTYSFNNTLYHQGKYFKYYRQDVIEGKLIHFISQTPASNLLTTAIENNNKKKRYKDWVNYIKSQGATSDQGEKFVNSLISHQILIPDFQLQLTAENHEGDIIEYIERSDDKSIILPMLKKVIETLLSNHPIGKKQDILESIIGNEIFFNYSGPILKGDLLLGTHVNSISEKTIKIFLNQFLELIPLTNSIHAEELIHFKKSFIERYEGQKVSLLEVLDPDSGIGYGKSPTVYTSLNNQLIGMFSESDKIETNLNNPIEDLIYRRYLLGLHDQNKHEVFLYESDLDELKINNKKPTSPPTIFAIGNLLMDNRTNLPQLCLTGFGGTSAANLITRFHNLSSNIREIIQKIADQEQASYPNSIIAEIVHFPDGSLGNILQRPKVRKAEIALMAKAHNNVISIDLNDLYLFIRKDRLILWSKKMQKEIIPKLTSAHNYHKGINLYRFLADLQFQHNPLSFKWKWVKLNNLPFLPRVRYKNIILSRAKWNITKIDKYPASQYEKKEQLETILKLYGLPGKVILSEGDNELPLDLSNPLAVDIFFEKLSKTDLEIYEFIYSEFSSPVKDIEGRIYSNEIIIPLLSKQIHVGELSEPMSGKTERNFMLGSKWIYIKIYCGSHALENLLTDSTSKLIRNLNEKNSISKWFFIRYQDPHPHLRLRLEIKNIDEFHLIVQKINEHYFDKFSEYAISNIQFDTYKREIERYTPELIELSEMLFHKESEFVLPIIARLPIPSERNDICLKYMDSFLNIGGFTISEKLEFAKKNHLAFTIEFGNNNSNEKSLNQMFRERKSQIENILNSKQSNKEMASPLETLKKISYQIDCEKLSEHEKFTKKTTLYSNYLHMFVNRMFPSFQRLVEYSLYHQLKRYYQMKLGKDHKKSE